MAEASVMIALSEGIPPSDTLLGEDSILKGRYFSNEARGLVTELRGRVWEVEGQTFEAWCAAKIQGWEEIREENCQFLTIYEVQLFAQLLAVYSLSNNLSQEKVNASTLLCIEGPLGVGKSTLKDLLIQKFELAEIDEDVVGNRWVNASIGGTPEEKRQAAFATQFYYRITKIGSLLQSMTEGPTEIIADRWLWLDNVFINWHEKVGNISPDEKQALDDIAELFKDKFPRNQFVILLCAEPRELKKRVTQRGRSFEEGLDEYWLGSHQYETIQAVIALVEEDEKLAGRVRAFETTGRNIGTTAREEGSVYAAVVKLLEEEWELELSPQPNVAEA